MNLAYTAGMRQALDIVSNNAVAVAALGLGAVRMQTLLTMLSVTPDVRLFQALEIYTARGIAQALARRLAMEAMSRGATNPFLMAGIDVETQIYERAGFHTTTEILHISK